MDGKVLIPVTANSSIVPINCQDLLSLNIAVWGTFGSATAVFEVSYNSTNGTDGIWFPALAVRSNGAATQENGFTALVNTPAYFWFISLGGAEFFRVRFTAFTSGTCTVALCPHEGSVQYPLNTTTGPTAHGVASSGNPVRTGGRAVSTNYALVAAGSNADTAMTLTGAQIVKLNAPFGSQWRTFGTLTTTADLVLKTASGASIFNALTDLLLQNTNAVATVVNIKDGATTIGQVSLPASMTLPIKIDFDTPLLSTANAALNIAAVTTGANVLVTASGFIGA